MIADMDGRITPKQVAAQLARLTPNRIRQMCSRGELTEPLAIKAGSSWLLLPEVVDHIRSRPERRGRPRKTQPIKINIET